MRESLESIYRHTRIMAQLADWLVVLQQSGKLCNSCGLSVECSVCVVLSQIHNRIQHDFGGGNPEHNGCGDDFWPVQFNKMNSVALSQCARTMTYVMRTVPRHEKTCDDASRAAMDQEQCSDRESGRILCQPLASVFNKLVLLYGQFPYRTANPDTRNRGRRDCNTPYR